MALKLELSMKLAQQLVMTPQLQMAIKLLQLNHMELAEIVAKEMEENPTLEEGEFESTEVGDAHSIDGSEQNSFGDSSPLPDGDFPSEPFIPPMEINQIIASDLQTEIRQAETKDPEIDWETYFDSYMDGPPDIMPRDTGDEDKPTFDQFTTRESTLFDYLIWQLHFSSVPESLREIGEEIIGNINEDGYLVDTSLEEIAERLNRPLDEVLRVHHSILRFEPVGVGSRDLRECLLTQAKFNSEISPLAVRILNEYWSYVEKRKTLELARLLKITKEEIEAAMREITSLDPRPGARFSTGTPDYITPDIFVVKVGDDYHVVLNEDGLPKLRLSHYYQRALGNRTNPKETRDYIKGKLRSASWLIRSIQQRQRTIFRVTEAIVKRQKEFLELGVEHLRPMILRDIAEETGLHECTVSRVTTNKYVHTPQGIFELKYFFSSGIMNAEGEDVSSESIKNRIRHHVDREDPRKPLSDQKLVSLLKRDGMDVARRTIAKYREALGILSSSGRRKTF